MELGGCRVVGFQVRGMAFSYRGKKNIAKSMGCDPIVMYLHVGFHILGDGFKVGIFFLGGGGR